MMADRSTDPVAATVTDRARVLIASPASDVIARLSVPPRRVVAL